ncbi:MAG: hypothetical protein IIT64_03660 [Bacteroidaceae bacterium]|nr:hypothetical protein [Bacteroidaceae bacterium]
MSAITYNKKAYRFVGSTTLSQLRASNETLTNTAIERRDDQLLIALIRRFGKLENGRPAEMPSDVIDYDHNVVFCYQLPHCDEEYVLFERE